LFARRLRDVPYDELNKLAAGVLTPAQRCAVEDEWDRRARVRGQQEQPSGAHDAELLARREANQQRWAEGSLTEGL
jgi:hypothetical protein